MKKTASAVLIAVLSFPMLGTSQSVPPPVPGKATAQAAPQAATANPLADYMRQIKYDGFTLSVVLVNSKTVEVLFQAPTKYSMRARANQETVLFIQGAATKDFDLPGDFTIEQDGQTMNGAFSGFNGVKAGKIEAGKRIDGIVEFQKKVDISKPFTVKNGAAGSVQFVLSADAIKALAPPPTPGER